MQVGAKIKFKDGDNAVALGYKPDDYFTIMSYDNVTKSIRIEDDGGTPLPSSFSVDHFDIDMDTLPVEVVGASTEHLERIEEHATGLLNYPDKKVQIVGREILQLIWDVKG